MTPPPRRQSSAWVQAAVFAFLVVLLAWTEGGNALVSTTYQPVAMVYMILVVLRDGPAVVAQWTLL